MPNPVIAIDGPSASGKSTVARGVAARLGYTHVDSGSLYRAITWRVLAEGGDPADPCAVATLAGRLAVDWEVERGSVVFRVDGMSPGLALRSREVAARVSEVAAVPRVRAVVNAALRAAAEAFPVVMEGRDIGSVVFPDAACKVYLDASPDERARRRHDEAPAQSDGVGAVRSALDERDRKDSSRRAAPLQVAEGAVVIDTTALGIEDVVNAVLEHAARGRA